MVRAAYWKKTPTSAATRSNIVRLERTSHTIFLLTVATEGLVEPAGPPRNIQATPATTAATPKMLRAVDHPKALDKGTAVVTDRAIPRNEGRRDEAVHNENFFGPRTTALISGPWR